LGKIVKDITGKRFGKLFVLEHVGANNHRMSLWKCLCDCGSEKIALSSELIRGKTWHCGCSQCGVLKGESGLNKLYKKYKEGATARGYDFDLDEKTFKRLVDDNCYICGRSPLAVSKNGSDRSSYVYNGIDRVNNLLGYNKDNCRACCKRCNIVKGSISFDEFKNFIITAYNNVISNGLLRQAIITQKKLEKSSKDDLTKILGE